MSQYKESILWGHNACTEGHSACDTRTEVQSQVIAVSHVTKNHAVILELNMHREELSKGMLLWRIHATITES